MEDSLPFFVFGVLLLCAIFLPLIYYVVQMANDIRLIKSLIAAFMEHKVAGTVAENKLANLVQEASKPSQ